MYQADPLDLCIEIFKLYHIRLQLFTKPYPNAEKFDFGLRKALYENFDYSLLFDRIQALLSPGEIIYIQDEFGVSYNIFTLKGGPVNTEYEFGVLGPWRRGELSEHFLQQIIEERGLKKKQLPLLQYILGRIPQNMEREKWITLCTRIIGKLISPDGNVKFLIPDTGDLNLPSFTNSIAVEDNVFHSYAVHDLSNAYSLEMELLNSVKKGNFKQADDLAYKYLNYQIQYRKRHGIPPTVFGLELNALLRHAVQEAGVFAMRLEDVYVKYCRLILRSQGAIPRSAMIRDYCNLVLQYSNLHFSPIIHMCVDYIDFFYSKPISLHELAAQNSVTEQYLSALFRKEVGVTFVDYLNRTRILHAKHMLIDAGLSMQEIADRCGFNDSSYFSRTFKKYTGFSPQQYRNNVLLKR